MDEVKQEERIAKVIARAGICSRREAEKLIEARQVNVNGRVIDSPALNVTDADEISVSGKKLLRAKHDKRLWLYHKPSGLVTSHKDELGRKTVFDNLPKYLPRLVSIGRLDLNTEGLLLMTNDGGLARYMELPSTGWKRCYRVRVYGMDFVSVTKKLAQGISIEGTHYAPIIVEAEDNPKDGRNVWVKVTLTEGKNREIRKVFEHLGCKVSRLIRVSYGVFELGKLKQGEIVEVPRKTLLSVFGKERV